MSPASEAAAGRTAVPFAHLHVASAFSAHYGVSWPEDLVAAAAAAEMDVLACTDRDGLYGMAKHVGACLRHGIAPVVGVDLAVRWSAEEDAGRVVVLARGGCHGSGYRALCQVVSAAHARTSGGAAGGSPWASVAELAAAAAGRVPTAANRDNPPTPELFVLVGPDADVGRHLARRRSAAGLAALRRWKEALPAGSLHADVVTHLSTPGRRLDAGHAVKALRTARRAGVPAVLTNAVRYAGPDGAATADVLDAVRALSSLDAVHDLQPNGQGWLKPTAAMHRVAHEVASAADERAAPLLEATRRLAEACVLDPEADLGWGVPRVPEAAVIGIEGPPERVLRERTYAGLAARYPRLHAGGRLTSAAEARDLEARAEHELGIITRLGFSSYFLTVAAVVDLIEGMGVRVAARGSGASSLVNHALRISNVDPVANGLIMERFLSDARSTLPDIDIDVESARRHEIYRAVFERFGAERTTLMSMQNAYRARGAVRDAGLALGMPEPEVDGIAKQLWRFSASSFREALERMPELGGLSRRIESGRAEGSRQLDLLVDLTERLDRLPRHISMHPCGVILGDAALLHRTPVQPSGMGLPMSQFDKHDMDPMGFLKLDILGVRMQSAIAYTLAEVERTTGERVDLEQVPLDDPATYAMIRTTHTLGCFQIESPGQRELVGKLAPREFNDLTVDISLFRPGPMQSDMVRPFLEQRHGWAPARYPHPDLRPVLAETHGVTVFHEQVLRTMDVMTGCGLARADEHRRLLGGPQEHRVEEAFRAGALARGYSLDVIDEVWATLAAFGSFGFCKAHGAAFAVPTYHSAWLKTHHPEAFMAAILEHDPGMYPARLMVAEARRMGIPVLPVDVNASSRHVRVEWVPWHPELDGPPAEDAGAGGGEPGDVVARPHAEGGREADLAEGGAEGAGRGPGRWGIRLPLTGLSGLSEAETERLDAGRPYRSLADVRDRARPTARNLERLAQLGALDCLLPAGGASRTDLVHHLELQHSATRGSGPGRAAARSRSARPRQVDGQLALDLPDTELAALTPLFPDPSVAARVRTELELTALDVTAHLMDSHAPYLDALGVTRAADLLGLRTQSRVLVAGVRVATQTPPMRSGKRVVFLSVDDGTGCVDASFFTEAQHASGEMLFSARLLLIEGTVRRTGPRAVSVQAVRAWDLHRSESLPDPDYLDATRRQWREWLAADRRAAAARRRGQEDAGAPRLPDIPHHGTGGWPVKVAPGGAGMPSPSSDARTLPGRGVSAGAGPGAAGQGAAARVGAGGVPADRRPIPVPHPETWELLPTPER
ncbi:DNA polymerase III subunit alpha [Micrococcus endophyticus]|uniref:DNA polymerase III subunit alpha n=1 Tax=Micrococcus endophyticus TaxID=455343 RepID=UPI00382206E4